MQKYANYTMQISLISALTCLLVWMFGMYWSSVATNSALYSGLSTVNSRMLWLAFEFIGLGLFGILFIRFSVSLTSLAVAGSIFSVVGPVLYIFGPDLKLSAALLLSTHAVAGLGSSFLLASIGIVLASLGAKHLLRYAGVSLLIAASLDGCLSILPTQLQAMCLSLIPAGFLAIFVPLVLMNPQTQQLVSSFDSPSTRSSLNLFHTIKRQALPLMVGFTYGLMQRIPQTIYLSFPLSQDVLTILAFACSAIMLIVSSYLLTSSNTYHFVLLIALPIVGVSLLLLPFSDSYSFIAFHISIVGFNMFYFLTWAMWAPSSQRMTSSFLFLVAMSSLIAGEFLGLVIFQPIAQLMSTSTLPLTLIVLVIIYTLIMMALSGISEFSLFNNPKDIPNSMTPGPQDVPGAPTSIGSNLDPSQNSFSRQNFDGNSSQSEYDKMLQEVLSQREVEVYNLLIKGRTCPSIAKMLYISENTVKSHMKSIYRKLDVHSQQELMDLHEQRRANT